MDGLRSERAETETLCSASEAHAEAGQEGQAVQFGEGEVKTLSWWAWNLHCDLNAGLAGLVLPTDIAIECATKHSVTLRRGEQCVTVKSK